MQADVGTNGQAKGTNKQPSTIEVGATVARLRDTFESGRTKAYEWRARQLDGLARMLAENERAILDALHADVGKPALEAYTAEVAYTAGEVAHARKHLRSWMKPERVSTPVISQPGTSRIHRDPLGVVLIIGPWNYPFQLVMGPLVGAIAAGNCVVLKPSEVAPAVSALVAKLVPLYLDTDGVAVIEGGVPETTALLEERFDHIFYTGNGTVGRIVMAAAAKHLTPVTLELGGKSPCIVDRDVDLEVAAKRIAWGKFFNAGQTCVAPDYVLVHEAVHDRLLELLTSTLRDFYGVDPKSSVDFGRIVNARHHQRLMKLLSGSGTVVVGGQGDEAERYLAPTILRDVPADSPVMAGEIFGPILPVLKVKSIDDAVRFINARPKPLALYVYSTNDDVQQRVLDGTSSGGAVVNHCWLHLAVPGLPFGGVGESGMGAYHGKLSFETFSHRKAVLKKPTSIDPPLIYPPYTESKETWIRRLL
jgi:aldehyde dehydrogenase (NAD+)